MNKQSILQVSLGILLQTVLLQPMAFAEEPINLCMENICIGDDLEQLNVKWKPIKIDYQLSRTVKNELRKHPVDTIYYDYNEQLVTDKENKEWFLPYIIYLQKFDQNVLERLKKVRAICTPLSLTGEVDREGETRLFVTFRAVADEGRRGKLRVVQIQKQFNIFPPHLRPEDKTKYTSIVELLKSEYPKMQMVRDIDARPNSNVIAFAPALLGYRFISDVNIPLVFKIQDLADIESLDYSEEKSKACPSNE